MKTNGFDINKIVRYLNKELDLLGSEKIRKRVVNDTIFRRIVEGISLDLQNNNYETLEAFVERSKTQVKKQLDILGSDIGYHEKNKEVDYRQIKEIFQYRNLAFKIAKVACLVILAIISVSVLEFYESHNSGLQSTTNNYTYKYSKKEDTAEKQCCENEHAIKKFQQPNYEKDTAVHKTHNSNVESIASLANNDILNDTLFLPEPVPTLKFRPVKTDDIEIIEKSIAPPPLKQIVVNKDLLWEFFPNYEFLVQSRNENELVSVTPAMLKKLSNYYLQKDDYIDRKILDLLVSSLDITAFNQKDIVSASESWKLDMLADLIKTNNLVIDIVYFHTASSTDKYSKMSRSHKLKNHLIIDYMIPEDLIRTEGAEITPGLPNPQFGLIKTYSNLESFMAEVEVINVSKDPFILQLNKLNKFFEYHSPSFEELENKISFKISDRNESDFLKIITAPITPSSHQ